MNRFKYFISLLIVLGLSSCLSNAPREITLPVDVNQRSNLNEFFEKYDYVRLETNDSVIVSKIDDFGVNDSIIALQSGYNIFTFDMNGKNIGVVSKRGNASSEYLEISDFKLSEDMIWVLSPMQKKIIGYDFQGKFVKYIELDNFYYAFEILDDGKILLASENCNDSGFNFALIDSKDGKVINRYDKFDRNESVILDKVYRPFIGKVDKDHIYVCHPFESSIYMISPSNFELQSNFSFNTESQLNGEYGTTSFIELLKQNQNQPVVTNFTNYYRNDNYELAVFPLFGEHGLLYNLIKIRNEKQVAFSTILEKIDMDYPYISSPVRINRDNIISVMQSGQIIFIEENNNLSTFSDIGLSIEDNPVVFFHKLQSE